MFVRWKKAKIEPDAEYRWDAFCPHTGPDRWTMRAFLARTFRQNGKVRQETLWRLGTSIRSCCIADPSDPLARFGFWGSVSDDIKALKAHALTDDTYRDAANAASLLPLLLAKVVPFAEKDDVFIWNDWIDVREELGHLTGTSEEKRTAHRERLHSILERRREVSGELTLLEAERILQLIPPWSEQDLMKAYRKQVFIHHPDRGGDEKSFLLVGKAHDLLKKYGVRTSATTLQEYSVAS